MTGESLFMGRAHRDRAIFAIRIVVGLTMMEQLQKVMQ